MVIFTIAFSHGNLFVSINKVILHHLCSFGKCAPGNSAGINVATLVVEVAFHEDVMSEMERPGSAVRKAVDAFMGNVLAKKE
jgi:hypothetical protein